MITSGMSALCLSRYIVLVSSGDKGFQVGQILKLL